MKKYKFTIIAVLIIALTAGVLHFSMDSRKKIFKDTIIFTHPDFKGYNLKFSKVAYVYDGDTVEMEDRTVIRYLGIDTPEISYSKDEDHEPGALEADRVNKELTEGKEVLLVMPVVGEYTYERLLAYIYAPVGNDYVSVTEYLLKEDLGDSKYGKPDPQLPYKIDSEELNAGRKAFIRN